MSTFYAGIDLHTRTSQLCVIDTEGRKVMEEKVSNELPRILDLLAPYGPDLHVCIESTINWYWLVDALQDAGYDVHLAHTLGLFMITGAKVKSDRRDAFRLAKYLRLDELPEAYIYPREKRSLRDFLRRRIGMVEQRASCYTSLRIQLLRHNLNAFTGNELKRIEPAELHDMPMPDEVKEYGIMLLERIDLLSAQIHSMEDYLKAVTVEDPNLKHLLTIPGVRYTLGLTINYEVDTIGRFDSPRHFASYCRLVPGLAQSADTSHRGRGGKQGNRYLKAAFTQAASRAILSQMPDIPRQTRQPTSRNRRDHGRQLYPRPQTRHRCVSRSEGGNPFQHEQTLRMIGWRLDPRP